MKLLLFFGFVAVALAEVTRFEGDKVFRLKPTLDAHVTLIKHLAKSIELDFWRPDSDDLVTIDIDVDIHVPARYLDMVYITLEQGGVAYEILIDDFQSAVDGQADSGASPRAHSYTKYNTWSEIEAWTNTITSSNPSLVSKQIIGNTYEGRSMVLLKIGKSSASPKPAIFMDCGFHAREWISPAFCQWFVNEAVTTYGSDSAMTSLLNDMDVYVLPVFNVDGYVYSHTNDRMWRKTRSRNSGSSCVGTDPNRNFNAGWCTIGASSNPCSDTFCGSTPESEIESKNVANFIRNNKSTIKAYLTIHSYSQLLLFPYAYTFSLAADHSELLKVAEGASAALTSLYGTRYTSGPSAATIYPAAGGSDDWAYDLGVKYSYTFELRDTGYYGFLLPESQIKPTCEETMLAVKYIAAHVQKNLY
ncbi:carboxypeptidase B [Poecilia latipinna]|nr:PREDICTED: carboxypeptidase B [Poecilia formosa]XP_014865273.1 PREDICTED: carboxypeptidase B-like [Poecilia mexicana]XP_014892474.1 PREDICTED: carboxypeptidase B-like [Poecilia latipinna]